MMNSIGCKRTWGFYAPWSALSLLTLGILIYAFLADRWIYCGERNCAHDLIGHWAAGDLARTEGTAIGYDQARLADHMDETFGYRPRLLFYFYPPHHLLVMEWLSALPYRVVEKIHLVASIAAWFGTLTVVTRNWRLALAGLFAGGGVLYSLWWVQHGMLFSSALLLGIAFIEARPRLAGTMLAAATVKPTLGTLVPLVLLIRRRWTALGWASLLTGLLVALTTILLGSDSWAAWYEELGDAAAVVDAGIMRTRFQNFFNVLYPFTSQPIAIAIHAIVAIVAAFITLSLWHDRHSDDAARVVSLCASLLLIPPYLYIYDFVIVSGAALLLWSRRYEQLSRLQRAMLPTSVGFTMFPGILQSAGGPIACLILLAIAVRLNQRHLESNPSVSHSRR